MEDRIDELFSHLDSAGSPAGARLVRYPEDEVLATLAAAGHPVSQELLRWFTHVGGVEASGRYRRTEHQVGPECEPLSLSRSAAMRREVLEQIGDPGDPQAYRPGAERLWPIGKMGMVVYGATLGSPDVSSVCRFTWDDDDMSWGWPSIESMVTDWVRRWDAGELGYDPGLGVVEVGGYRGAPRLPPRSPDG